MFEEALIARVKQYQLDMTLTDEERIDKVIILRFEQMEEIHAWNWVNITVSERVAPGTKDEFELMMEQKAAEAVSREASKKAS